MHNNLKKRYYLNISNTNIPNTNGIIKINNSISPSMFDEVIFEFFMNFIKYRIQPLPINDSMLFQLNFEISFDNAQEYKNFHQRHKNLLINEPDLEYCNIYTDPMLMPREVISICREHSNMVHGILRYGNNFNIKNIFIKFENKNYPAPSMANTLPLISDGFSNPNVGHNLSIENTKTLTKTNILNGLGRREYSTYRIKSSKYYCELIDKNLSLGNLNPEIIENFYWDFIKNIITTSNSNSILKFMLIIELKEVNGELHHIPLTKPEFIQNSQSLIDIVSEDLYPSNIFELNGAIIDSNYPNLKRQFSDRANDLYINSIYFIYEINPDMTNIDPIVLNNPQSVPADLDNEYEEEYAVLLVPLKTIEWFRIIKRILFKIIAIILIVLILKNLLYFILNYPFLSIGTMIIPTIIPSIHMAKEGIHESKKSKWFAYQFNVKKYIDVTNTDWNEPLNIILSRDIIKEFINDFIIFLKLEGIVTETSNVLFQLKMQIGEIMLSESDVGIEGGGYRSLGKRQIFSLIDLDNLNEINYIIDSIFLSVNLNSKNYISLPINGIWIDYKNTNLSTDDIPKSNDPLVMNVTSLSASHNIHNNKIDLPITIYLHDWAEYYKTSIKFNKSYTKAKLGFNYNLYEFLIKDDYIETIISHITKIDNISFKIKDIYLGGDFDNIHRIIYYWDSITKRWRIQKELTYYNGQIDLSVKHNTSLPFSRGGDPSVSRRSIKSKSITSLSKRSFSSMAGIPKNDTVKISNRIKISTFDLETRKLKNGNLEVISACIFNGNVESTFYINDYSSLPAPMGGTASENLLFDLLMSMIHPDNSGYSYYAHNLSGFDGIFILKTIAQLKLINEGKDYDIELIKNNNKIISIKITRLIRKLEKDNIETIKKQIYYIYDSLLLLPSSLNKLAKAFGLPQKLEFSVLDNDSADLNSIEFRNKLLEYNLQDCKILYWILIQFNKMLEELFKVSINKMPTLPSISFKIYRTHYINKDIPKNKKDINFIPITPLNMYKDISSGYYGGAVDVYKPSCDKAYCYDVNSLYPFIMANSEYPVGDHQQFTGRFDLNKLFGLAYCNIKLDTKTSIANTPFLLHRNKSGNTIAATGSWSGWYTSEELREAKRYGYEIEIIRGYHWPNRSNIFRNFINYIYNLRLTFDKLDPRNLICKLILNSLYGRFGMSPILTHYDFINTSTLSEDEYDKLIVESTENITFDGSVENIEIIGKIDNHNSNIYPRFKKEIQEDEWKSMKRNYITSEYTHNLMISTPIAMFTTAYARIYMAKLKIKYRDDLLYSDTDSLFLTRELPNELIGKDLGKFKLEYKINSGVFIAPKTYGLILENGTELVKVKGFKYPLKFNELKSLLSSDKKYIELKQQKFYKNLSLGNIKVLDQIFTLKITDNKREIIYENNIFTNTKPYNISELKLKPHQNL